MKLSSEVKNAVKERRNKNYALILHAFIEFMEEEREKEQFVDDTDITDIYIKDVYPYDLLAASIEFCHCNLSNQLVDGCLSIMNSQIEYLDQSIHQLTILKNELKTFLTTNKIESLHEFLLNKDRHYKSFCDKYNLKNPTVDYTSDEEENRD